MVSLSWLMSCDDTILFTVSLSSTWVKKKKLFRKWLPLIILLVIKYNIANLLNWTSGTCMDLRSTAALLRSSSGRCTTTSHDQTASWKCSALRLRKKRVKTQTRWCSRLQRSLELARTNLWQMLMSQILRAKRDTKISARPGWVCLSVCLSVGLLAGCRIFMLKDLPAAELKHLLQVFFFLDWIRGNAHDDIRGNAHDDIREWFRFHDLISCDDTLLLAVWYAFLTLNWFEGHICYLGFLNRKTSCI